MEVPLCCVADCEVEERGHDELQGEPIRTGDYFVGGAVVRRVSDFLSATRGMMGERGITVDHATLNR